MDQDMLSSWVRVDASAEGVRETLMSAWAYPPLQCAMEVSLVLDTDNERAKTFVSLLTERDAYRLIEPERRGGAGCFDALVAESEARFVGLVDSGWLFTEGALTRLLRGFDSAKRVGLVGPSLNRGGGPQQIFDFVEDRDLAIEDASHFLRQWYTGVAETLSRGQGPLSGCVIMARGLAERIGPAHDIDGGDLWATSFAARARVAGFKAMWVPGAYVHVLGSSR